MEKMNQQMAPCQFKWKILAIGGSSGIGKTVVAQEMAKHFGISVREVDEICFVLKQKTTPTEQPGLHFFTASEKEGIWEQTPEQFLDGLTTVGEAISPVLETLMAHYAV